MRKRSEVKKSETKDESVEDLSRRLDTEMKKAKEDEAAADAFDFEHANRPKATPLRPDADRIVSTIFLNDVADAWEKLESGLRVGEKSSDHGTLFKALDEAESNARLAHRLFVTMKVVQDEWEKTNEVVFGALWSEANQALQDEKDQGIRSKQITDADVRARCAVLHPDEWKAQEIKRARLKATVATLENLSEVWLSRCKTLQTMLGKSR
jgi:hypothetical protein